ncbi:MAG: hypothetical protein Q7R35_01425 [Elusimicrobiota bacterium]|nr:hypothetical protein [Elusimicrobiota bacterium]
MLYPPLEQADVQFVPPGLNVKLVSGSLEVTFSEVTAGGQIFVNRATQYPEVPGYRIDKDNAYDLVINAAYRDIKVKACMNTANLSENQVANAELYHYSGVSNAWEKVTTERGGGCVAGISQSASPFVVLVPVDDKTAPETGIGFKQGAQNVINGQLYVSTDTYVNYYASDFAIKGDITGVATIYSLINIEPTPGCLTSPFDGGAPKGTCANPRYTAPFKLNEGLYALHYFSSDKSSNSEYPKTALVYADGTPPFTEIVIGTTTITDGGMSYIDESSSITITAFDPQSKGVASGRKVISYLVDVTLESCGELGEIVPTAPAGSCRNYLYTAPFSLPVGTHTVYYSAMDNVGNVAAVKSFRVNVGAKDPIPQESAKRAAEFYKRFSQSLKNTQSETGELRKK